MSAGCHLQSMHGHIPVEVDIGKKLTRQIADRDTAMPVERCQQVVTCKVCMDIFLRVATINNQIHQPQRLRVPNLSAKLGI